MVRRMAIMWPKLLPAIEQVVDARHCERVLVHTHNSSATCCTACASASPAIYAYMRAEDRDDVFEDWFKSPARRLPGARHLARR